MGALLVCAADPGFDHPEPVHKIAHLNFTVLKGESVGICNLKSPLFGQCPRASGQMTPGGEIDHHRLLTPVSQFLKDALGLSFPRLQITGKRPVCEQFLERH